MMIKISALLFLNALLSAIPSDKPAKMPTTPGPVTVIELFTSQGCSSCPPADLLLAETIAEAKKNGSTIIALSFHIDYWNRLGWKDPFSSKAFSERQEAYASRFKLNSVYTPQMIVNGSREFVGSDAATLKESLRASLNNIAQVMFKTLSVSVEKDKTVKVNFVLEGKYQNCNINFALLTSNENTAVPRGENAGRTLSGVNIVKQFVTIPARAEGEINFENIAAVDIHNMFVVAFVQQTGDYKITGAGSAAFPQ